MASGRIYSASFRGNLAAQGDLLALYAPATMAFEVHEVILSQYTTTSIAFLQISLHRLMPTVTQGSGGSANSLVALNPSEQASVVTSRALDTTHATTSGNNYTLRDDAIYLVQPYQYLPLEEDRPVLGPNQAFVVSLDTTPTASLSFSGVVVYKELY